MNLYGESKLSASDRRALITKWVGNYWSKTKNVHNRYHFELIFDMWDI